MTFCKLLFLLISSPGFAATQAVTMKSISFDPKRIEIKVNDSVEWVNKSYTSHSALADDKTSFDTGSIEPNKSSQKIKFATAGVYKYHCAVHGKTMSGVITVLGQ